MKTTLVRPATFTTTRSLGEDSAAPIGIAYLAACLQQSGHYVNVVDALGEALDKFTPVAHIPNGLSHGLLEEEIIQRIPVDTELIGVSAMFSQQWSLDRELIRKLRPAFPLVPIVIGGEHATALPEYCLTDSPETDHIVLGEGEVTLVELVSSLESGSDLGQVSGLYIRRGHEFVQTDSRKRIRQIDEIPRPAWNLLPIANYLDAEVTFGVNYGRAMPMLASRGCPFQCTFCSNPVMYGPLWRARSPQEVFQELVSYKEKYNATSFDFYDLTAIVKRSWIKEFCNLVIESEIKFTWQLPTGTRSEALDWEITDLLNKAGCKYLVYAPESGSVEVLKMIKKKVSLPKLKTSLRGAHKNGLGTKVNIIFGFPGETLRNVSTTYKFIVETAVIGVWDMSCFPFSPYPGSEIFENLRSSGSLKVDEDYFSRLAQYTDPSKAISYSRHIPTFLLPIICTFGIALFYFVAFLVRPVRFVRTINNLLLKTPKNKLEAAIFRLLRKRSLLQ